MTRQKTTQTFMADALHHEQQLAKHGQKSWTPLAPYANAEAVRIRRSMKGTR